MTVHDENKTAAPSKAGMTVFLVVGAVVVLLAVAWAAGLFSVETEGTLAAPNVEVSGGSVPDVDVNTADITVGTREEVIEVPTVDVTPADKQ